MNLTSLIARTRIYVQAAPDFAIAEALGFSTQAFTEQTTVWRDTTVEVPLVQGQGTYTLTAPEGAQVQAIYELRRNGIPLTKLDPSTAQAQRERLAGQIQPRGFASNVDGTLSLANVPAEAETLVATVSYAALPEITVVPDWLGRKHHLALVNGAAAELLGQKGSDWFDQEEALKREFAFQKQVADARRAAIHGTNGAALFFAPPRVFG